MMYQNKFVAALKVDGNILRESSNTVSLPFGSEYSILLKNLNSVRAMAQVTVNGQDATDGAKLILSANGSVELERFIKGGNFGSGNRFKFIERTESIEEHRGILVDDGLVRVEFWTEKVYPINTTWYGTQTYSPWLGYTHNNAGGFGVSNTSVARGLNVNSMVGTSDSARSARFTRSSGITGQSASFTTQNWSAPAGITVPGSESDQKFVAGSWFATEYQTDVLVLQLRGEIAGQPVQTPVTVATRPKCVTCGKVNWSTDKYCSECGTSLYLI